MVGYQWPVWFADLLICYKRCVWLHIIMIYVDYFQILVWYFPPTGFLSILMRHLFMVPNEHGSLSSCCIFQKDKENDTLVILENSQHDFLHWLLPALELLKTLKKTWDIIRSTELIELSINLILKASLL